MRCKVKSFTGGGVQGCGAICGEGWRGEWVCGRELGCEGGLGGL